VKRAWWFAVAAELVYVAGRFAIYGSLASPIGREWTLTAWRLVILAFDAWLFRDALRIAVSRRRVPRNAVLLGAVAISLAIAILGPKGEGYSLSRQLVFAATTVVVGLREEVFYRLILQGGLRQRLGPGAAIAISTLLFLIFHVGAQPMVGFVVFDIVATGVLLGVIYERTGNVLLVVILHTVIDWLWLLPATGVLRPVSVEAAALLTIAMACWWHAHDRRGSATPEGISLRSS
jgi:membrane protease YdiL (CAAX protease family)